MLYSGAAATARLEKLVPGSETVLLSDTGHDILGQTEKIMAFLENNSVSNIEY
jgi:hypothetical protein